jgi:hypothetical protein
MSQIATVVEKHHVDHSARVPKGTGAESARLWGGRAESVIYAAVKGKMARLGIEPRTPRFSGGLENPWLSVDLQDFFW